jgi:uncharacterized membrane protein YeaQ/YmgE (transglycosylase-associated protein family)
MALIGIAAVGVVVGILAHLILGADGYSWFGEIILAFVGAVLFGLITGIFVGMREIKPEVIVASLVGAVIVEGIVVLLTLRSSGRALGRSAG